MSSSFKVTEEKLNSITSGPSSGPDGRLMLQNGETGVDIHCKVFAFGSVVLNVNDNTTRSESPLGPRRLRYLGWSFGLGFENA
jgi:hypothetical protein